MANLTTVTTASFNELLKSSTLPILVDFGATWCAPCKMLEPYVEKLAAAYAGKMVVVKLDIDENQDTAYNYQVMGVPTLMLFKNGQPVDRTSGFQPYDNLVNRFSQHL
jgi:thioredoxin 1